MSVEQLQKTEQWHNSLPLMARSDGLLGRMSLPALPDSICHARGFVQLIAYIWDALHVADDAELCVSELATNAYQHAAPGQPSPFVVIMRRTHDRLRCEVHDHSTRMPQFRDADALDETGRGLSLVAALADDHGAYETPHGKAVWCELITWPYGEQP